MSFKRMPALFLSLSTLAVGCSGSGLLSFDADDAGGGGRVDAALDGGSESGDPAAQGRKDGSADGVQAYSIGGSIAGLTRTAVLQDNGGDSLTRNVNGAFAFATPLPTGASYDVTVLAHPVGHVCIVSGGTGIVPAGNVTSVTVDCSMSAFTVGGSISGLAGTLVLRDNGRSDVTRNANGSFTFSEPLTTGSIYDVTILTQPVGQRCTVANGSGSIAGANVTNVSIACTDAYSIGGTISGLTGTVALQNNGGDNLVRTANGSFTFPMLLAPGATYNVTVLTQPAGKACGVNSPAGTVGAANVSSVSVTCI